MKYNNTKFHRRNYETNSFFGLDFCHHPETVRQISERFYKRRIRPRRRFFGKRTMFDDGVPDGR